MEFTRPCLDRPFNPSEDWFPPELPERDFLLRPTEVFMQLHVEDFLAGWDTTHSLGIIRQNLLQPLEEKWYQGNNQLDDDCPAHFTPSGSLTMSAGAGRRVAPLTIVELFPSALTARVTIHGNSVPSGS